jgi:hypothetical protein
MARVSKKKLDTTDIELPNTGDVRIKATAQGIERIEDTSEIDIMQDNRDVSDLAAQLAFLEEPVTITIHETSDPNPEPVFLAVNGVGPLENGVPWLPRGRELTIKRKFVEALLRAKVTTYGSKEIIQDGERMFVHPSKTSLKYPFSIVRDDNPKGRAWFTQIVNERA